MQEIRRNDLSIRQECLVTEITVDNEKCFFTCLYRSPNQNHEELENFISILDLLLSSIIDNHSTGWILIDNFDAISSKWCNSNKSNRVGIEPDNVKTSSGYSQLINEPMHFLNKAFSCIDLIFCSDLNITSNCGIEKTNEKCHHDITYRTLDFNVPVPPTYYRNMQILKKKPFQKAISMFHWQKAFKNSNTNEITRILTDTVMNIFKNFILHKTKKFDCKHPQ